MLDVEVVQHGTEVEPWRPSPVMTPAEAADQAKLMREMLAAVLQEGTDYGKIPGVGKPSLFKSGAEWLLKWFGFTHRFEVLDVERDEHGKNWGVTYRCVVTRQADHGEVTVGTCDGYASRDEKKWVSAPWNTIIKMAQKRALVGAALQATGTSGLFTQDMEDTRPDPVASTFDVRDNIAKLSEPQRDSLRSIWKQRQLGDPAALNAEQAFVVGGLITMILFDLEIGITTPEPLQVRIMATAREHAVSDVQRKALILELTGGRTDSSKQLTDIEAREIISRLEQM